MDIDGFRVNKLTLIGVGLIGGSLLQALREEGVVEEVVGVGRSEANLRRAVELDVIDRYEFDAASAAEGADMVVVATPVNTVKSILSQIAPVLSDNTIVTDVGSVKQQVIDDARVAMGDRFSQFVAGHPVAGAENSGVEASFDTLFQRHKVIITPTGVEKPGMIDTVASMWQLVGADVVEMNAENHDRVLSVTSHLPHILAYTLVEYLEKKLDKPEYYDLAAGGFYDFTRIASSDPTMWRDISLSNQAALSGQIRELSERLEHMAELIDEQDGEQLKAIFSAARNVRQKVGDRRQKV